MDLRERYDLELLKERRDVICMTNNQLAKLARMSATTVGSILEYGTGRASSVQKIAQVLGIPMQQVLLRSREVEQKTA